MQTTIKCWNRIRLEENSKLHVLKISSNLANGSVRKCTMICSFVLLRRTRVLNTHGNTSTKDILLTNINADFVRTRNRKTPSDITMNTNSHSSNILQITSTNKVGEVIKKYV